jgi:hypothetical protein
MYDDTDPAPAELDSSLRRNDELKSAPSQDQPFIPDSDPIWHIDRSDA